MESRTLVMSLLITFCIFVITTGIVRADPVDGTLEMMPSNSITKAKDDNVAITCIARVAKRDSISNFQWFDPQDRLIDDNYLKTNARYTINNKLGDERQMLLINNLKDQDVGDYKCQVKYDTRTLKAQITVKTYQPIKFVDAPAIQFATVGEKYKLKCEVAPANPSPQISWVRIGGKLDTDNRITYEPDGLVFQQVKLSDDGQYQCDVVLPENGDFKTQSISFEVVSQPVIDNSTWPPRFDVIEGEATSLRCNATGKPAPTITWIKTMTGQNLTTGYDGQLYIDKITRSDNGNFLCIATNKAGRAEKMLKFNVQSKPEVIESANTTAAVGQSAKISCSVYGNPAPNVIIRKQGYSVSVPRSRRRREIDSNEIPNPNETVVIADPKGRRDIVLATLNFPRVERYMDGLYECVASNKIGGKVNEIVRNLHLTVEFKPTFEKTGMVQNVVSWKQRPANLTCVAEAIPNATITWYRGTSKEPLRNDPPSVYSFFRDGPKSILQITPSKQDYYGPYKCKAQNIHGEAVREISFIEAFPPSAVKTVDAVDVTATTITFRISDPISNNMPIRAYVVQYIEEAFTHDWQTAFNHTWFMGDTYILTNLRPLRRYAFRFAAVNEVGYGEFGSVISQQMPEISVPSEPIISNPIVRDTKYIESPYATKIELRWIIPAANGAPIEKYIVNVCPALEEGSRPEGFVVPHLDDCVKRDVDYKEGLSVYLIDGLRPEAFYQVQCTAENSQGSGPSSTRYFKTNDVDEITNAVNGPEKRPDEGTSSAVIIYAVVAILIAVLVIVDIFCFFVGETGVVYLACRICCGRKKKNDDKLGSESKDLISNGHNKKIDIEEQTPMIVDGSKKDTAVEYDVKKGTSKTGFVGKDSAV